MENNHQSTGHGSIAYFILQLFCKQQIKSIFILIALPGIKRILFFFILLTNSAFGQNIFKGIIKDDNTKEILRGVSAIADSLQLKNVSAEKGLPMVNYIRFHKTYNCNNGLFNNFNF